MVASCALASVLRMDAPPSAPKPPVDITSASARGYDTVNRPVCQTSRVPACARTDTIGQARLGHAPGTRLHPHSQKPPDFRPKPTSALTCSHDSLPTRPPRPRWTDLGSRRRWSDAKTRVLGDSGVPASFDSLDVLSSGRPATAAVAATADYPVARPGMGTSESSETMTVLTLGLGLWCPDPTRREGRRCWTGYR